ncbi:MAG: metallopeptidase family protein [Kofleriaceae bacterium]|jgi:tetratricopeptide (TPR) repeat protein|nr:metallopeptidase family protein [Kofleriaceae bacterium]MBP9204279.1 metallopeptidase family protein [Kofleriaceae bacterium]
MKPHRPRRRTWKASLVGLAALVLVGCGRTRRPAGHGDDASPGPGLDAAIAPPPPVEVIPCPVPHDPDATAELDQLLDAAHAAGAERAGEAYTCADRAADLEPESVEAHHLRAEALTNLGRLGEAEGAYRLALALDPADPDTLRAVADFLLAVKPERSRDDLRTALALAQRGARLADARSPRPDQLLAALLVLVAQAENELGRADRALGATERALEVDLASVDARYERGLALFNLLRFAEAEREFRQVLGASADDAFAHHSLGLVLEWLGQPAEAIDHLTRAEQLAPRDFPPELDAAPALFRAEIDGFLADLPPDRQAALADVAIEVADLPAEDDLRSVEPPFPPTILGLFRGLPAGADDDGGDAPARAIVLYRKNLLRAVTSVPELRRQIRETLAHELGHFDGHDEDELRRRGME